MSRTLVTLGCIVLLVAAAMHCLAYQKISAPAVHASNLPIALQFVFEVAFLSMAWSWIVLALIVLVATCGEARLGKPIALICGFAVLIQAVFTVAKVGFFIKGGVLHRKRNDRCRILTNHYRRLFVPGFAGSDLIAGSCLPLVNSR